ncbi:hypothetical protein [Coleofasciculus chthonoplastes]|jgi:hypothetical protein|uniref:hypothetical protein n=1 Tax=Coleofasciculus chthonoplastes TaxID=64178 RepID=UPI0040644385
MFIVLILMVSSSSLWSSFLQKFRLSKNSIQKRRINYMYMPEDIHLHNIVFENKELTDWQQWLFHEKFQNPSEISFKEETIQFNVKTETQDEWAYIFLDPTKYRWRDVSWKLSIRRDTPFREFAFNFRYQDFDNRYRYRFENNFIYFDKKIRGIWYNNIASVRFPMSLEIWHDLQIDAYGTVFRCYVDGILRMENSDIELTYGSIAIILWETDGVTDMVAKVSSLSVQEIARSTGIPEALTQEE